VLLEPLRQFNVSHLRFFEFGLQKIAGRCWRRRSGDRSKFLWRLRHNTVLAAIAAADVVGYGGLIGQDVNRDITPFSGKASNGQKATGRSTEAAQIRACSRNLHG
jgi:hypothetical protein